MVSARKRRNDEWRKLSAHFSGNSVPRERSDPAVPVIFINDQCLLFCLAYRSTDGLVLEKAYNPFLRTFLIPWQAITHIYVKSLPNTYREHRRDEGIAEIGLTGMPDTLLGVPWIRDWKTDLPEHIELKESWHEVWWQ